MKKCLELGLWLQPRNWVHQPFTEDLHKTLSIVTKYSKFPRYKLDSVGIQRTRDMPTLKGNNRNKNSYWLRLLILYGLKLVSLNVLLFFKKKAFTQNKSHRSIYTVIKRYSVYFIKWERQAVDCSGHMTASGSTYNCFT